jgi:hypothetical protein
MTQQMLWNTPLGEMQSADVTYSKQEKSLYTVYALWFNFLKYRAINFVDLL